MTPPGDPGGVGRLPGSGSAELRRFADELTRRLRRWTAASWTLPAEPATGWTLPAEPATGSATPSRAAVAAGAVQRIADLGADAERRERRPVPRLADPVLADQLAVVVDDAIRAADPAVLVAVAAELTALRAALGFRAAHPADLPDRAPG